MDLFRAAYVRGEGGKKTCIKHLLQTTSFYYLGWNVSRVHRGISRGQNQSIKICFSSTWSYFIGCSNAKKGSAFAGIIKISLCYLKHCQKCILIFQPTLMNSLKALFAFYLLKIVGIINAVAPKTQKANTTITSNKNSQKYNLNMRKNLKNGNQTSRFWRMIFLIRFNLHIGKKHKSPCLQPLLGRMESVKKLL